MKQKLLTLIFLLFLLVGLAAIGRLAWMKLYPDTTSQPVATTSAPKAKATKPNHPYLQLVPANTLFFVGGLERANLETVLQSNSILGTYSAPKGENAPLIQFFQALANQFFNERLAGPANVLKEFGIRKDNALTFYTVGIAPVLRFEVDNEDKFWHQIETAAESAKLNFKYTSILGTAYRQFALNPEQPDLTMIVGIQDGNAIVTLLSDKFDMDTKSKLLGKLPIANNILESGTLTQTTDKYRFEPAHFGYIDFTHIADVLLKQDNGLAAQMIEQLEPPKSNNQPDSSQASQDTVQNELEAFQTPACQKEISSMIAQMPRVVGGTLLGSNPQESTVKVVLEIKNNQVLQHLSSIRGFIPKFVTDTADQALVNFGLGINMESFAPAISALWTSYTESPYQCQPLEENRQSVKQQSPAMLSMMLAQASSIRGLSLSVQDIALQFNPISPIPKVETADALVVLSTTQPKALYDMAAAMNPMLGSIVLDPSGKPSPVPFGAMLGIELNAAIKGNNIVLFTGENSAKIVTELATESLTNNGFMAESINYSKINALLSNAAAPDSPIWRQKPLSPADCILRDDVIHQLHQLNGHEVIEADFTKQGFVSTDKVFSTKATEPSPHKIEAQYDTYLLDNGCVEILEGVEQFTTANANTGVYRAMAKSGECDSYETTYKWTRSGQVLEFNYLEERSRPQEDCGVEFDEWQKLKSQKSARCHIRNESVDGFECIFFDPEGNYKIIYKKKASTEDKEAA
jgi:hypothetical protein